MEWITSIINAIGVQNVIQFCTTLVWVAVIGLPVLIILCRKYDIPLRIAGLSISPKKVKTDRRQNTEMSSSIAGIKKTHRTCPLFSQLILILETAQEHSKSLCSITLFEKINSQMAVTEQQLKFLSNGIKKIYTGCLSRYYSSVDDHTEEVLRLSLFSLMMVVIIGEVKLKFKDIFVEETLSTMSIKEWESFKKDSLDAIILLITEVVDRIYPRPLFNQSGCEFDSLMRDPEVLSLIKSYINQLFELAKEEELYFINKEKELTTKFVSTMNKIIDCDIDLHII